MPMLPYQIALQEFGTKGIPGTANNPEVLRYFAEIGDTWIKDDETPWCAAFMNWCLLMAGYAHSAALNARSFLTYGVATTTPQLGDIVVLWRGDINGPFGHVAFFVKQTDTQVFLLGGNQSDSVDIAAFDKVQVLGYRSIRPV